MSEIGKTYGRWIVTRSANPARRYGEGYLRARVWVKCKCGREQIVFVSDLRSNKTSGCRSLGCLQRWRAAAEIRGRLGEFNREVESAIERFLGGRDD